MRKETNSKPAAVDEIGQGDDGFLSRWSRRKQGLEPVDVEPLSESEQVELDEVEEAVPEKVLTDEDMPPVESLNETSDYSGFLSPEVSGELKKLALRKLFRSAKFNITDGLDDYDDDFRSFAALGDIITSDMKHRMEVEAEKKKLEEETAKKEAEARVEAEKVAENEDADSADNEVQNKSKESTQTSELDAEAQDPENENSENQQSA